MRAVGFGVSTALLTYFTLISPLHSIRQVTIAAGKAFFLSPGTDDETSRARRLCPEKCYPEIRGCASRGIRPGRRCNYTTLQWRGDFRLFLILKRPRREVAVANPPASNRGIYVITLLRAKNTKRLGVFFGLGYREGVILISRLEILAIL